MRNKKEETVKVSARLSKSKLERLAAEYQTNNITELLNRLMDEKLEQRFASTDTKPLRSVITGIGAKNRVAAKIIRQMPKHSIYIEPFGNTASILLQKEPVKIEVFNDINRQVTNFFQVLRDNPMGLYNGCTTLPYSEEQYARFVQSGIPDDPLEQAVRFFYMNRCGFLGTDNNGFRTGIERNNAAFYYRECERFYTVSKRFQTVEILNKDFAQVIRKYRDQPDAFILADPPYYDGFVI